MHAKKPRVKSETFIGGLLLLGGAALTVSGVGAEVGIPMALIGGYIVAKGQGVRV